MDDSEDNDHLAPKPFTRPEVSTSGSDIDCYDFNYERRGIAIIIVNDKFNGDNKRDGCDKDMLQLQSTFAYFGFEIHCFLDRTAEDLIKNLTHISKDDHSKSDCLVIAITTHGEEIFEANIREDVIFVSDKTIKTRTILDMFTDDKCPTLKGKPRLVFIQACRGNKLDSGSEIRYLSFKQPSVNTPDLTDCVSMRSLARDQTDANPDASQEIKTNTSVLQTFTQTAELTEIKTFNLKKNSESPNPFQSPSYTPPYVSPAPCYKDFLVMYATPPGYFAFRRVTDGSWFISSLCQVLKAHVNSSENLLKILTKVVKQVGQEMESKTQDEKFNAKKQSPVIYSRLTRNVFLKTKVKKA